MLDKTLLIVLLSKEMEIISVESDDLSVWLYADKNTKKINAKPNFFRLEQIFIMYKILPLKGAI